MGNPSSTPVSIFILTLDQTLQRSIYARNNRAALISTLGAFAELPEVEYLWHGLRDVQGWKHDQIVILIVWQAYVAVTGRPALPVERLLPFLAGKPHGAPTVVFDVTLPGPLKELVQHPGKAVDLECIIEAARIKGRRTAVAHSIDRKNGYHGLGNVFYEDEAYQPRAWDLAAENAVCRIRIDVQTDRPWAKIWSWWDWWEQETARPVFPREGSVGWPGTVPDRFCAKLQNPVAVPGVRHMPGTHTIVVPYAPPKPILSWPVEIGAELVGERKEVEGKETEETGEEIFPLDEEWELVDEEKAD